MTNKPQPFKNVDGQRLAVAVRACEQMVEIVGELIDEVDRSSPGRRARALGKVGTLLAEQRCALAEMEKIRGEVRGGRSR